MSDVLVGVWGAYTRLLNEADDEGALKFSNTGTAESGPGGTSWGKSVLRTPPSV
jgi:hypothetical protein